MTPGCLDRTHHAARRALLGALLVGRLCTGCADSHGGDPGPTRRAVTIVSGGYRSCAILEDGAVACWGRDPPAIIEAVPPMVALADYDATASASGGDPAAVDRSGIVWALGADLSATDPYDGLPHPIAGLAPSVAVGVSALVWCAILRSGAVWCWGDRYGLGRHSEPSEGPPFPPGPVDDLSERAIGLIGSGDGFVVLGESGALYSWRSDELLTRVAAPPADTFCVLDHSSLCYVAAGVAVCSGQASVAGSLGADFTPVELRNVAGVACGGTMTCAWLSDASTWCWGAPPPGSFVDVVTAPVRIALPPVTSISGGAYHMCAITEDGRVFCWGGLDFMGLGGDRNVSPVEVRMP